jgi:hypothetical protein
MHNDNNRKSIEFNWLVDHITIDRSNELGSIRLMINPSILSRLIELMHKDIESKEFDQSD